MDDIYTDPSHPAAFGGVNALARASKQNKSKVEKFLHANNTYQKFFRNKFKFERAKIISPSIGHTFQSDLFDMKNFWHANGGHRYIVVLVDCFSRLVKARPVKHKTAPQVASALREMYEEFRSDDLLGVESLLATDAGKEYLNVEVKQVFRDFNVSHYILRKPKKASLAEISGRYLLDRIYKYMHHSGVKKWVHKLQEFVSAKNKRYNRTIGMSSEAVAYENQVKVYKRLFPKVYKQELPLSPGTKVLLVKERLPFHKSFFGYFDDEVYEVAKRIEYFGVYRYTLIDTTDGVKINSSFYRAELFPID